MGKNWNKIEVEVLKENYVSAKWEDLLNMLPDKTEKQIISKASKLGLKRESEIIDIYYDEEKKAWVKEEINYNGMKFKSSFVYPAPKGTTFEQVMGLFSTNVSKVFAEMIQPKYLDFITTLGIKHSDEIYSIFFEMEKQLFCSDDKNKREDIIDKFLEDIKKSVVASLDKEKS